MMNWVFNDPENSNAFMLVNSGYDVWMGNSRGCKFGLNHETLDVKSKEFWRFD